MKSGVLLSALYFLIAPALAADSPRIISLAPHLTELAYDAGIGERMVGASAWSDVPDAARRLPRIGDAFRFDAERMIELNASHALAWRGGTPAAAIAQLRALGIDVVEIETRTLDQIGDALVQIGEVGQRPTAGLEAARQYRDALSRRREQKAGSENVRVFYQVSARPLFTLGGRHVINELLALCDASNVFADLDIEAASVGAEAVIDAHPDVILVGLDGNPNDESPARASAEARVHPALADDACLPVRGVEAGALVRPTPRILDAADQLCMLVTEVRENKLPACRSTGH